MKLKATYTRRILAMMYFPDCEPACSIKTANQHALLKMCFNELS